MEPTIKWGVVWRNPHWGSWGHVLKVDEYQQPLRESMEPTFKNWKAAYRYGWRIERVGVVPVKQSSSPLRAGGGER